MEIRLRKVSDLDRSAWEIIQDIYDYKASGRYGLSQLNQYAHAVQTAELARLSGSTDTLILAALMHDVGHMIHNLGDHPAAAGIDDCHEERGAAWLSQFFGPDVTEPVRLHVAAKRYLCATEKGYLKKLSEDSMESLMIQGGPMSHLEIAVFESLPYFHDAVQLRRFDEMAKDPKGPQPGLSEFESLIHSLALERNNENE
jgi:predicted HD phosphohydrolase